MYNFTRLSHIVDGLILPTDMRVWVVRTHTRTRLPDGYMMLSISVPTGRLLIPYPSPYRVTHVRYSGFGYLLSSLDGMLLRAAPDVGSPGGRSSSWLRSSRSTCLPDLGDFCALFLVRNFHWATHLLNDIPVSFFSVWLDGDLQIN
jgi:hypothetical protein